MSDFNHALNLTHDGTLILRIPKGYQVDKVVVEEMGTENRKEYQPTHKTPSNVLDALDCVERQAAIDGMFSEMPGLTFDGVLRVLRNLPSAQPETCEGCKHFGKWEYEVEYGYPSPCTRCKRRVGDHYER